LKKDKADKTNAPDKGIKNPGAFGGDWQNFSVGGYGRYGWRGDYPEDGRMRGGKTGGYDSSGSGGIRDNNTMRGRDRYGSRQVYFPVEDEKINAGFRESATIELSGSDAYYLEERKKKEAERGIRAGIRAGGGQTGTGRRADSQVGEGQAGRGPQAGGPQTGESGRESFSAVVTRKLNINSFTVPAFFIKFILAVALSFSIIYAAVRTSGLGVTPQTIFMYCLALTIFFSILMHNAYVANGLILASIAAGGIYIYNLHRTEQLENYRIIASYYFRRYTYWAASFFYTGQPHIENFEFILFMIICSAVCLFVYFVTIKRYLFPLMFAAGFATFCVQWCFGFFAGLLPFVIFICVTIVGYIWFIYLKNRSQYGDWSALFSPAKFLKSLTPLFLSMALLITIFPTPDGPIRMQWLYDFLNNATTGFYDRFYYYRVDSFALNTTGFSGGESFLSGPVRINNTHVLTVVTDDPALYLKGNGKEIYTGNSWKNPPYIEWLEISMTDDSNIAPDNINDDGDGADSDSAGPNSASIGTVSAFTGGAGAAGTNAAAGGDEFVLAPWSIRQSAIDILSSPLSSGSRTEQHSLQNPASPDTLPFMDRQTALQAAGEAAEAAAYDISQGLAEPRSARVIPVYLPASSASLVAVPRAQSVTDFESPDLTDINDMEAALARMDAGMPSRIPGPLYAGGGTDVDLDVTEYNVNHMLYLYRLMVGGSNQSLIRLGVTTDTLQRSSRWMLGQGVERATVYFDRMKTFSLFTPPKLLRVFNINFDVGEIYEESGALSIERIMTEGFAYDLEFYMEDRQEAAALLLLYNSYPGLYRDLLDDYGTFYLNTGNGEISSSVAGIGGDGAYTRAGSPGGGVNSQDGGANAQGGGRGQSSGAGSAAGNARGDGGNRRNDESIIRISDIIDEDTLYELAKRADDIRLRYTGVPDALPERVWILAEQLTEGLETGFEKASALEKFLYENYEYSLNVGYLPANEDFVDNFLFKHTEGYCTHFASALAVMARCLGLPARYVEGYTMPSEISEDGVYRVTNAEAHAWVEIFFEGYGWRKFEPTATYQNRFKPPAIEYDATYIPGGGGEYFDYFDFEEMMREYGYFGYESAFDPTLINIGQQRASIMPIIIRTCLIALAVLAPISVIAVGRRRAGKRFSAFSAEPGLAVRSMYRHYLKILKKLKYGIEQGETLTQFANRVDGALKIGKTGLASAIDIFEKLIYSNHALTETDKQRVRAVYPQLLTAYSLRKNKVTFFFVKDVIADI